MKIRISLYEINQAFNDLIQGKRTREEIANWATKRQFARDDDNLEFIPLNDEDKIWDGIEYLTGVDLLDLDGSYLHSIDNFIDARSEIGLEDSVKPPPWKEEEEALRQPIAEIKEVAEHLVDTWLMCPLCQEAWESPSDYPMVKCPKCNHLLHNPLWK